jgi:imidazole glycerol phosphate synthase glutamine amidotransferase subunit
MNPARTSLEGRGGEQLRVAVIDYGAGNLVSVEQALRAAGATVTLARTPDNLLEADALVVPGVGAARPAMARLARVGLVESILAWIGSGRPFLGICLGLQLLFEGSEEDDAETLGVIPGRARRLAGAPTLPHTGWNQVVRLREHALFEGITNGADFYFVHSYAGEPEGGDPAAGDPQRWALGVTTHGEPFTSAVAAGNVLGVQFHPERSGVDGLRLLANFVDWAGGPAGILAESRLTAAGLA